MICKVCGSGDLCPLPFEYENWRRCLFCGSDTNPLSYADVAHHYRGSLMQERLHASCSDLKADQATNLDWFAKHSPPVRSFLDIGSCTGAGVLGMRDRGFEAFGWDVSGSDAQIDESIILGERYSSGDFDRRFGCVLLRETIEHVEDWRDLIAQASASLLPNGLLQIQTPRPTAAFDPIPYQEYHLQLFSPLALRAALIDFGLQIVDKLIWPIGQAWLCRRGTM